MTNTAFTVTQFEPCERHSARERYLVRHLEASRTSMVSALGSPKRTETNPVLDELRSLRGLVERQAKTKAIDATPMLLPVSVVAQMLGRSRARTYELCLYGELRSIKDGASILIPADEPAKWLARKLKQR